MSFYFVYFLRSRKDGSLYIGQTNNIEKRLVKHNKGQVKSTKNKIPFDLSYFERFNTRSEAMFRERILKSPKGIKEKKKILRSLSLDSSATQRVEGLYLRESTTR